MVGIRRGGRVFVARYVEGREMAGRSDDIGDGRITGVGRERVLVGLPVVAVQGGWRRLGPRLR